MKVNYLYVTAFTAVFLIFLASTIGGQLSDAASGTVYLAKPGLLASDPLNNETKTQGQLEAEQGYWSYNGDAITQNANYTFFKDAQGLHLGVQAPSDGTYAGLYAKSPNTNALLFHAVTSVPVRSIQSSDNLLQNGINVKTSQPLINYISCASVTDDAETKWIVGHTYGTPFQSTAFDTLYVDTSPNQPLARECTIITNGQNYLKVYLDRVLVYSSDTLALGMPAPFDVYLQSTSSYDEQLIQGTYTDYYITSGESITIFNSPANATTVTITDQFGEALASALVSDGNATINVGQFHFPLNGKINVYDSSNTLLATTPSSVNLFGGDHYSADGPPPPTAPQPPTNLSAIAVSSSQIDLDWSSPSDNGGSPITGYQIERSSNNSTTWSVIVPNAGSTVTAYSDTDLSPNTTYSYRVSAINSVGTSSPSNVASTTTLPPPTPPQPPTNLSAAAVSSSQIDLGWNAPVDDGGSAITGYQIERSDINGTTWSVIVPNTNSAATAYSDTGLTNSTTYQYRVSAINSVGTSSPSNIASATTLTPSTPPQPPTNLSSIAVSSSQIDLGWNAPSDTGSSPITGYKIERSTDGGSSWSVLVVNTNSALTTYSDTGLSPSTTYSYRVSAINSGSTSSPSNVAAATTSVEPPSITLNNVQSTSGRTSITNQIVLSGFDIETGEDKLLVVGVQASSNPVSSITFGGTQLTKAVSSFTSNTAELWYLKNPSGTGDIVVTMNGPASVVVGAYSFIGVDQANPIPTTATNNGSTNTPTISITTQYQNSWVVDSASIHGDVSLGSNTCVQRWNANGTGSPLPFPITGASSSTIQESEGLTTCSWAASRNDLWDNVAIELKVAPAPTAPSPPTGLSAVAFSPSQISLNWSAPSNDGGSPITGYQIERSDDNGATWSVIVPNTISDATAYSDTGLAESTSYQYRVSAINFAGTSAPSNVASATTSAQSSTITVYAHRISASYWASCFAEECDAGTGPGATMYFALLDSSGNKVREGFADEHGYTFSDLNQTATYYVYPADCGMCHISFHDVVFEYWGDNFSDVRPRAATTGTSLHAWYSCSNSCGGLPH